jgi:hypothetical protein
MLQTVADSGHVIRKDDLRNDGYEVPTRIGYIVMNTIDDGPLERRLLALVDLLRREPSLWLEGSF